jgi:hypothetical protein
LFAINRLGKRHSDERAWMTGERTMEKQKKATRGQIGRIMAMLTIGQISFSEAQAIIERNSTRLSERPKQIQLRENEYLVPVAYDMPRDKGKLEAEFSKDGVSDLFYGNYEWQPHSSCAEIDQTPGNRVMLVKHFGRYTESEANIASMDKLGYRPATHLEAYAFAKANPELQRQFWIVALGSSAVRGDDRDVAVLYSDSDRRILGNSWFDSGWNSDDRFLFVRK